MRRKFINELLNIQHKSKSSEYELNAMQFHVLVSTNIHNQYSLPSSALTAEHMDMQRWRFRTKECNTHEGELEKANETRSHHKNLKHISVIYNAVLLSRTKVIMGSAAVAFPSGVTWWETRRISLWNSPPSGLTHRLPSAIPTSRKNVRPLTPGPPFPPNPLDDNDSV